MALVIRPFVVSYDYGTGPLWGVVRARSAAEITAAYPELRVTDGRPSSMTEATYQELADDAYDVDEPPRGLLQVVVTDRRRR